MGVWVPTKISEMEMRIDKTRKEEARRYQASEAEKSRSKAGNKVRPEQEPSKVNSKKIS